MRGTSSYTSLIMKCKSDSNSNYIVFRKREWIVNLSSEQDRVFRKFDIFVGENWSTVRIQSWPVKHLTLIWNQKTSRWSINLVHCINTKNTVKILQKVIFSSGIYKDTKSFVKWKSFINCIIWGGEAHLADRFGITRVQGQRGELVYRIESDFFERSTMP